ncbi:hypothetical protein F511_12568 [Dorcoceras hygrometricum]|uniref:Dystroglycan-like n=1 Tax=Dorcoceras hygrometricum TaxID=472368 RepID=A0A2Z7D9J8_9LAMI|nr:hypothetical protein F511_12568 [Dorcoceras hygrometricum]
MASSLISNSHHIDFDSVFGMEDAGMVQMFESLIAMGLKEFLGCPAVIYEAALTELFANGSVRDGLVVSTIGGTVIEISEEMFATTLELSTEGLTDFSEVPKDLVFDARSLFSISKEQVSVSCLKKELKIEYHLLHDILAKTIFVKAGSFDAVTRERFMLMTAITFDVKVNLNSLLFGILKEMVTPGSRQAKGYAIQICVLLKNIPGLELGESRTFPVPRVLTKKTVHRYVVINEKVGMEETTDSPKVKKTPAKRAVSQKKPAAGDVEVIPVVKKKRTTKGKPVAVEAVPLQIVEETAAAPVEQLPVPKRKIQKRKTRLVLEAEDDLVVDEPVVGGSTTEHPAAEAATGVQEPVVEASADDPDAIIEQVLDQLDSVATTDGEDQPVATTAEERHCDTDEDMEQVFTEIDTAGRTVGSDEEMSGDCKQAVDEHIDTDEAMSLEDILLSIPTNVPLPSAGMEITKIAMGKEIKSQALMRGLDIDLLVHLRAQNKVQLLQIQINIDLSDDSSLHFDENDDATVSISLPAAPIPDVTKALAQLRASIEQISERDDGAKHKDTLLFHLHDLERKIIARFDAHDRVLGALRKDSNDQRILMSLDLKSSHKQLSTQIASNDFDVVDVRRVVREHHQELNAKITSLDEQVAATRHDFLEFSAQAQQTLNIITDQLSELVAYINRGGNDKKGEVSSSRPPPDDQNRGSGNTGGGGDSVRTTNIPQRDIDNAQRNILERLMSADRARERERRSKSRSGSGSYKRRR